MPFVRRHGHQLAIVHGERDPESGQVQQRVLFTVYSRAEAEALIGKRKAEPVFSAESMIEHAHPGIRFDWPKLRKDVAALMDELPDEYLYRSSEQAGALGAAIVEFTRALHAANPQELASAAEAVRENRGALSYVGDLIAGRLKLCDLEDSRWNRDNEFGWRQRMRGTGIPIEAEEVVDGLWQRRETEQAEAVTRLMLACYPDYAEGHNRLGVMALEREDYAAAAEHFVRTMDVGRTLFPKRIAKARWWHDHATRPYMRGLRNLAITYLWSRRYDEALLLCDRLEQECHDEDSATVNRAHAYLNLGRWREAHAAAARLIQLWPEEDFVAAFAAFESGDRRDALGRWLHAAIGHPRAARMLVRIKVATPPAGAEIDDHNRGVDLSRVLSAYLERPDARRFFTAIMKAKEVAALVDEYQAKRNDRNAYARLLEMGTPEFARARAAELARLVEKP